MTTPSNILYTARVHTTGGRRGTARSSDAHLDIKLSTPGGEGSGTNPEQLFAAGWSACFEGATGIVARKMNVTLRRVSQSMRRWTFAAAMTAISSRPVSISPCRV